jgi:hypothetical protein
MAMVTGLVLIFAFTAGAVIWLARDVNRSVSNRSAAQSIAFQAARSGAQQLEIAALRGDHGTIAVDPARADGAARETARALFAEYGVDGTVVTVRVIAPDAVEVEVRIADPAGDVIGIGSARAEAGP